MGVVIAVFVSGCEKSELEQNTDGTTGDKSFYRMTIVNDNIEVEAIDINALIEGREPSANAQRKEGDHNAMGLLKVATEMATFNAVKNNGGVNGNTHYSGANFLIDVHFDSECLLVIGNKAYWGGTITKWDVADPSLTPVGLGWRLYWSAIDNGEGSAASPDEFGDTFIVVPPGEISTDYGFDTWCDYADFDYNLDDPSIPHSPHGYYPGDNPTNVQVN